MNIENRKQIETKLAQLDKIERVLGHIKSVRINDTRDFTIFDVSFKYYDTLRNEIINFLEKEFNLLREKTLAEIKEL